MLTFLVIFVIFWWLILFIILPTGIDKQKNVKFGNDPGAPNDPMLKKKFLIIYLQKTRRIGLKILIKELKLLKVMKAKADQINLLETKI